MRRPRLRGRSAGLYGISGGLVAAASPRIVHSRLRASPATRREIPSRAGRAFSHWVISPVLRDPSSAVPQAGPMNRRIRYSRVSLVLMPTSWSGSHRSIHSLTVIFPAFGSVQRAYPNRLESDQQSRPATCPFTGLSQ